MSLEFRPKNGFDKSRAGAKKWNCMIQYGLEKIGFHRIFVRWKIWRDAVNRWLQPAAKSSAMVI
jgi:hypothetical protein